MPRRTRKKSKKNGENKRYDFNQNLKKLEKELKNDFERRNFQKENQD